ncbi:MAG: glycosyltransferase family 2 protein [Bryobacterales bacterium]|nr:glycosyltransferase family 2 protein [Bryobacterales bacterium]
MKDQAAAVIVTYESAEVIGPCVESCLRQGMEVVVVDNASQDGTAEAASRSGARVIANAENRGFGAAVNQGIGATKHPFVLLLNPDAVVEKGIEVLVESCSSEGVAAAAGRLLDEKGSFQLGFSVRRLPTPAALMFEVLGINRIWRTNPVNRRYRYLDLAEDRACDVEQPAGAFFLTRRDAWEAVGGFDERFFPIWFEDVDYCRRLVDKGLRIRYEPAASARHLGGHSAGKLDWGSREVYWYASLLKYACKHFPRNRTALVCLAVAGGSLLRLLAGIPLRGALRSIRTYGKVIRLAGRCLLFRSGGLSDCFDRTIKDQAHIHVL